MENSEKTVEKVIILGSGPAGLSAAIYAARAELHPLLFTGTDVGGQAATTSVIENYPGFPEGVGGNQLADLFTKNAEKFGARFEYDMVTAVDLSRRPFKLTTYGKEYFTQSLIITTGASPNKLNIAGEKELTGRGVSYCATCDGWFFKDKKVAVVGGGDSALEEGIFLTRYASSVTIIHRRNELRAGVLLQKRAKENPKISFILDTVVEAIEGKDAVSGLELKNIKNGESNTLAVDGVFIFVGHSPNTDLFRGVLDLDEKGYIRIDERMRTNIAGVFAAGEVADSRYRQVVTSAGMGAAAAIEVTRFLESGE
ncbi:MAG: thioredoxin-disulfide reductase [Pelolinea sp.]|jgi:thioredoxin reductase (NADPH)|nr:thioredoxin-disulfide reductase [Pelolinea sp.]